MPSQKMEPKLKKKWVKALRSGRYRQTAGQLCKRSDVGLSYCCLGVLARCTGKGIEQLTRKDDYGSCPADLDDVELGRTVPPSAEGRLITMNDADVPFSEIADWIEENL